MRDCFKADDCYYMRRMKEILEAFPYKGPPFYPVQICSSHLYIGNQRNADDVDALKRLGITHVLNCAGTRRFDLSKSPYPSSSGIKSYLMIPAEDHDHYDIMKNFPDAIAFLDKCKSMGGKALVHCNLGVNRSGAICAAYTMVYEQRPLLEVISHLKDKRQFILCNKNFRRQLIRFARCKGLLDNVTASQCAAESASKNGSTETKDRNGHYYSTQSLDRNSRTRISHQPEPASENNYSTYSLPRHSRNSYLASQNNKNNQSRYDSYASNGSSNFQLESVPERKPICDFVPTHSRYDRDLAINGTPVSLPCSAPSTPKSVTFRRPTISDTSEDVSRVRSPSVSQSPKLGFLSRLSTKITRQRSLTNLSRSSLDDDDGDQSGKRSSLKGGKSSSCDDVPVSMSTTRPLRVYKRASTDTELYRKPSTMQTYRRAETIASANPEMERHKAHDEPLLPQEFLYHKKNLRSTSMTSHRDSGHSGSSSSLNLLARLKPVSKSRSGSRTNTPT